MMTDAYSLYLKDLSRGISSTWAQRNDLLRYIKGMSASTHVWQNRSQELAAIFPPRFSVRVHFYNRSYAINGLRNLKDARRATALEAAYIIYRHCCY